MDGIQAITQIRRGADRAGKVPAQTLHRTGKYAERAGSPYPGKSSTRIFRIRRIKRSVEENLPPPRAMW